MARRGVRILRARNAGTGYGGTGNPTQVAGTINSAGATRSGSVRDADQLRAFAAIRDRVRSTLGRTTIGSKGRL
jgi:hypothetical protein